MNSLTKSTGVISICHLILGAERVRKHPCRVKRLESDGFQSDVLDSPERLPAGNKYNKRLREFLK